MADRPGWLAPGEAPRRSRGVTSDGCGVAAPPAALARVGRAWPAAALREKGPASLPTPSSPSGRPAPRSRTEARRAPARSRHPAADRSPETVAGRRHPIFRPPDRRSDPAPRRARVLTRRSRRPARRGRTRRSVPHLAAVDPACPTFACLPLPVRERSTCVSRPPCDDPGSAAPVPKNPACRLRSGDASSPGSSRSPSCDGSRRRSPGLRIPCRLTRLHPTSRSSAALSGSACFPIRLPVSRPPRLSACPSKVSRGPSRAKPHLHPPPVDNGDSRRPSAASLFSVHATSLRKATLRHRSIPNGSICHA